MSLLFSPVSSEPPGTIAAILRGSYRQILSSCPALWAQETAEWDSLDNLANELNGDWIFLTKRGPDVIGLASFDPRGFPEAIVGHNCILPEYRGLGYGNLQMRELLRVISARGFKTAAVSTGDHPFFVPAQRMYLSCGFQEVRRGVEPPRPFFCKEIQYRLTLDGL